MDDRYDGGNGKLAMPWALDAAGKTDVDLSARRKQQSSGKNFERGLNAAMKSWTEKITAY